MTSINSSRREMTKISTHREAIAFFNSRDSGQTSTITRTTTNTTRWTSSWVHHLTWILPASWSQRRLPSIEEIATQCMTCPLYSHETEPPTSLIMSVGYLRTFSQRTRILLRQQARQTHTTTHSKTPSNLMPFSRTSSTKTTRLHQSNSHNSSR